MILEENTGKILRFRINGYLLQETSDDMMKERPDSVIRKRSLAEELAERLRQRITDGQFEVGEKLPAEPELMRIFGVGRSTVREAREDTG